MSTQLTEIPTQTEIPTNEERAFALIQRKANAFIKGSILPSHFRSVGDVVILEEMSRNLKIPLIMLAQQLYIVKGKATMSGQLSIAIINGSKRFDKPLTWEERANPWGVRVKALLDGDVIYGEWITDELIRANGWGSQWKTNKGLMARYRSASWFGRLYCPDLLMGFATEGENEDSPQEFERVEVVDQPENTKEIEVPIDNFEEVVEEVEIEPTTGEVSYSQDDINKFIQKHKNTHLQQLQEVLSRGLDINSTMFELQQCLNS